VGGFLIPQPAQLRTAGLRHSFCNLVFEGRMSMQRRFFFSGLAAMLTLVSLATVSRGDEPADKPSDKPRVLLLGDSISIGYTPFVQEMLKGEAVVVRPMRPNGTAENCSGTTNGVKQVDRWLAIDGGKWDVIHVNFGLHDLKHVDPKTGAASPSETDPPQADPAKYEKQLREIVGKLKRSGAKVIVATTTPYPAGVKPFRAVEDAAKYNEIALRIAKENDLAVDDLYAFALPRLKEIQRPVNVHFTPEGSKALAGEVVQSIRAALPVKGTKKASGGR
jgi:acyl-CoA thioesterase-1